MQLMTTFRGETGVSLHFNVASIRVIAKTFCTCYQNTLVADFFSHNTIFSIFKFIACLQSEIEEPFNKFPSFQVSKFQFENFFQNLPKANFIHFSTMLITKSFLFFKKKDNS